MFINQITLFSRRARGPWRAVGVGVAVSVGVGVDVALPLPFQPAMLTITSFILPYTVML